MVRIESAPIGAQVVEGDQVLGLTPIDLSRRWWPWHKLPIIVRERGFRSVSVDLSKTIGPWRLTGEVLTFRWRRLLGKVPRQIHRIELLKEHGKVGTWSPDEAG